MSVVIEQTFPLGRFHATRWNQNPFEDRISEWPPSPWRLLRALAARWFQYQRETSDDDANLRDELLRALAGELPSFRLPAQTWRGPELRQYHPTQVKFTKKKEVPEVKLPLPSLTLDRCRTIPPDESVYWVWRSCTLSPKAIQLLFQLLRRIHYFGRAETWTKMYLLNPNGPIVPNCELRAEASSGSIPVLAYRPNHELDIDLLFSCTEDKRLSDCRIPPNTAWFHAEIPPSPRRPIAQHALLRHPHPQVVRYALDSTVLPLVTETLPVAEAARRALMGIHGRLTEKNSVRGRSDILSGKDEHAQPLAEHRHAYYLPTDEDGDGRLDHLTVCAAAGFGLDEQHAFDRLRELRMDRACEERHPLRLLLLGMGTGDEYAPGPLQASKTWESATPYIATRYAKTRGRNRIDLGSPEARAAFLQEDLRAQLATVRPDLLNDGASVVRIEPMWDRNHVFTIGGQWRSIQFSRFRRKASDDGGRRLAGAFRLTFPAPVRGSIALGWSSHFGMGLFTPVEEPKRRS